MYKEGDFIIVKSNMYKIHRIESYVENNRITFYSGTRHNSDVSVTGIHEPNVLRHATQEEIENRPIRVRHKDVEMYISQDVAELIKQEAEQQGHSFETKEIDNFDVNSFNWASTKQGHSFWERWVAIDDYKSVEEYAKNREYIITDFSDISVGMFLKIEDSDFKYDRKEKPKVIQVKKYKNIPEYSETFVKKIITEDNLSFIICQKDLNKVLKTKQH